MNIFIFLCPLLKKLGSVVFYPSDREGNHEYFEISLFHTTVYSFQASHGIVHACTIII